MNDNENQVVSRLTAAKLENKPFDYCCISQFFDDAFYQQLLDNLPDHRHYKELRHPHCLQPDGSYARLEMVLTPDTISKLPASQRAVWQQCYDTLASDEVKRLFLKKFEHALTKRFRSLKNLPIYPEIVILCDLVGYRIGIHSDTTEKLVTMQCYLPEDASQQSLGTRFHRRNLFKRFRLAKKMQFLPNSGYAFPVMHNSWHSVDLVGKIEKPRYSLMLNYYKADTLTEKVRFIKLLPTMLKKFKRPKERPVNAS